MPEAGLLITSASNPRIKQIRKMLRDKKEREQSGLYYIEGLRQVGEAVQMRAEIEELVVAPELLTSEFGRGLVEEQRKQGRPVLEVAADVFKEISVKDGPQGIGALARQRWIPFDALHPLRGETWVGLYEAADPGNLGTILRTSDSAGGCGVILIGACTDPYDPSALRAGMGATFSQKLVKTSLDEFLEWKKREGIAVYGTSDKASLDFREARYPDPLVLLMGSERQGLPAACLEACDGVVSIAMAGRSDSLNLSIAAGIVLYEVYYQRHARREG